jgi:hypothetical protein
MDVVPSGGASWSHRAASGGIGVLSGNVFVQGLVEIGHISMSTLLATSLGGLIAIIVNTAWSRWVGAD